MAKKVWISLPLITTADGKDEAVVNFLKGGAKKGLEVETAAFIMKWLIDRNVPFVIDFESSTVDRATVFDALPKRLQRTMGHKVPSSGQPGSGDEQGGEPASETPVPVAAALNSAEVTIGVAQPEEQASGVENGPPEK